MERQIGDTFKDGKLVIEVKEGDDSAKDCGVCHYHKICGTAKPAILGQCMAEKRTLNDAVYFVIKEE